MLLVTAAEVQSGAVRVRHEDQAAEATRIAGALSRAVSSLPAWVGAERLEVRAQLSTTVEEFTRKTGLPPTAAAGVVEDEIVFPPARVTARFENLDQVARHEVAHLALLEHWGKGLPRWFVEGLGSLLAGAPVEAPGAGGCAKPGQVLALDRLLLENDPAVREAAYRRAAQAVAELARLAGGAEKLWGALPERPSAKQLSAVRLGGKSVAEVYRQAATCR